MFVVKGQAEVKNINVRAEVHGDELMRAIDVKLVMADIEAKKMDSAVPGLVATFWKGQQPLLQEVYPLKIRHKIENVLCTLKVGRKTVKLGFKDKQGRLHEAVVKKISVTPQFGGRCQVTLTVSCLIGNGVLDPLHRWLKAVVNVNIVERQMELPAMNQKQPAKKVTDIGNGRKRPKEQAQEQPAA